VQLTQLQRLLALLDDLVLQGGDLARLAALEPDQIPLVESHRLLAQQHAAVAGVLAVDAGTQLDDLESPSPVRVDPPGRVEGDRAAVVPGVAVHQRVHPDPVFVPGLLDQVLGHPLAEEGDEQQAAVFEHAMVFEQPAGPVVGQVGVDAEGVDEVEGALLLR
jgi:hypothetical protein